MPFPASVVEDTTKVSSLDRPMSVYHSKGNAMVRSYPHRYHLILPPGKALQQARWHRNGYAMF